MLSDKLPFPTDPSVEEVQRLLGAVIWHHVAGAKDLHEGEIPTCLHLSRLVTVLELQILDLGLVISGLTRPLQSLGPTLVSEPVADKVSISGIDQDLQILEKSGHEAVVWLHPVTLEQEVPVDIEIARVIAADFDAELFLDILLIEELADPVQFRIAQVAILALLTDIIYVLASSLEWADHGVVAIDACRNTRPHALAVVAILNKALAAGKGIVHRLAFTVIENSRVSAITASHGPVVFVLGQAISETIADKEGFQVDVSVLVCHDLCRENRNVVASIRFACDVEVLLRILWELLKEEGEESIDILSSSDCVANGVPTV